MNNQNSLGQQANISLENTKAIQCEVCGGQIFMEGLMLREVSPLLTGTGQRGIVPIPVFHCIGCGHVNNEFIPAELKEKASE